MQFSWHCSFLSQPLTRNSILLEQYSSMAGYHSLPSSANSDIGDCNSKEFVERDFALNGIASDGADGHNYTKRTQGAAKLTSIKLPSTAPKKQAPCFFMKLVPCLKKLLTEKKENPESANQVDSPSEPQEKCATTTSEIQEPHRFFSEALCDSGLDELASKAHTVGLRIDLTSGRTPTVQNFTTIAFAEPREHLRPQYLAAQDAYINALMWGRVKRRAPVMGVRDFHALDSQRCRRQWKTYKVESRP